jgi:hypothetical protein
LERIRKELVVVQEFLWRAQQNDRKPESGYPVCGQRVCRRTNERVAL